MRPALSDYQHLASGKVRELYRIDDGHLLFVATDRISAFVYVLDSVIPDKGRILTAMSVFFFDLVEAPNHLAGPPDDPRIPDEVLGRALAKSPSDRSNNPAEQENDGELNKKLNSKMYVVHRLTYAVWTLTEWGRIGQDQHCLLTDYAT